MKYLFETNEFGLSKESFHLLRNRYNFKTYQTQEITSLLIEKGKQINNWILVFIIGLSLVAFSIYYSVNLFNFVMDDETRMIYIEQFVIPLLPLLIGGYCLYESLRTGPVIRLELKDDKTKSFPLARVKKDNRMDLLMVVLKDSTDFGQKLVVNI